MAANFAGRGAASAVSPPLTARWAPRAPHGPAQVGPRTQRRRESMGRGSGTVGGAALRCDLFEKLWSARALPTSRFLQLHNPVALTRREESVLTSCFNMEIAMSEKRRVDSLRDADGGAPSGRSADGRGSLLVECLADFVRVDDREPAWGRIPSKASSLSEVAVCAARAIEAALGIVLHQADAEALMIHARSERGSQTDSAHASTHSAFSSTLQLVLQVGRRAKAAAMASHQFRLASPIGHFGTTTGEDPYCSVAELVTAFSELSDHGPHASADEIEGVLRRVTQGHVASPTAAEAMGEGGLLAGDASLLLSDGSTDAAGCKAPPSRSPASDGDPAPVAAMACMSLESFEQRFLPVDPWKSTAARLFMSLGGDPSDPQSRVPRRLVAVAMTRLLRCHVSEETAAEIVGRWQRLSSSTALTVLLPPSTGDKGHADARMAFSKPAGPAAVVASGGADVLSSVTGDTTLSSSRRPAAMDGTEVESAVAATMSDAGKTAFQGAREGGGPPMTFEEFDLEVVQLLRVVCGGVKQGGSSDEPPSAAAAAAGASGANPPASGSGKLTGIVGGYSVPPKMSRSAQVAEALAHVAVRSSTARDRYERVMGVAESVFVSPCTLAPPHPLSHLAPLTRRRIARCVAVTRDRRTLFLRPQNKCIEAFLRTLTAAARVLAEHSTSCTRCRRLAESLTAAPVVAATSTKQRPNRVSPAAEPPEPQTGAVDSHRPPQSAVGDNVRPSVMRLQRSRRRRDGRQQPTADGSHPLEPVLAPSDCLPTDSAARSPFPPPPAVEQCRVASTDRFLKSIFSRGKRDAERRREAEIAAQYPAFRF